MMYTDILSQDEDGVGRELASFESLLARSAGTTVYETDLQMYCAPNVLPPNNRVSRLLAAAIQQVRASDVLDIGCGSGILSLVAARKARHVVGIDIDSAAIEASQFNSSVNGIENVSFLVGDMFSKVINKRFDLIVCNPPLYSRSVRSEDDLSPEWIHCVCDDCSPSFISAFISGLPHHLTCGGRSLFVSSSLSNNLEIERLLRSEGLITENKQKCPGRNGSQDVILWSVILAFDAARPPNG